MIPYLQLPDGRRGGIGVLLVNSGTPDSLTVRDVRRFVKNLLSDPRVVELPRTLWLSILHALILPIRSPRIAKLYRSIWTADGSPLSAHSASLRAALDTELAHHLPVPVRLEFAMLYSEPSILSAIRRLKAAGVTAMLVLPLFPQYCGTTIGAVYDAVNAVLKQRRFLPELRFVSGYHDEPAYIAALHESVVEHWSEHGRTQHLVISFHGIPESYARSGDPYLARCRETAGLLAKRLGLSDAEWSLSFQSRFGPGRWLQPYTKELLPALPGRGISTVSVICPGFALDSLETCHEIGVEYRQHFLDSGGERFEYIPALNARQAHAHALAEVITRHCSGWVCPVPPAPLAGQMLGFPA